MKESHSAGRRVMNDSTSSTASDGSSPMVERSTLRIATRNKNPMTINQTKDGSEKVLNVQYALNIVRDTESRVGELSNAYCDFLAQVAEERALTQVFCENIEEKLQEWEIYYDNLTDSYEKLRQINRLLVARCRAAEKRARYNHLRKKLKKVDERKLNSCVRGRVL